MRSQFDPVPFAKEFGLPVDEVTHVLSGLVCNTLYFAKRATKRGEDGMNQILNMYVANGTPTQPWGKLEDGKARLMGELSGVAMRTVEIILRNGNKYAVQLSQLSDVDIKYH